MKTDVIIVGGGPCGLMATLLLARADVSCVLFERNPSISTHPKAMRVSRRSAEIYRQLGLSDKMAEGSLSLEDRDLSVWSKSLVGEELGRIPFVALHSPLTPCTPMHCPQTWTEKVLLDAVMAEANASVVFGETVEKVGDMGDEVRVLTGDGEEHVAQWVVAADGTGSRIRRALDIGTEGPGDLGHFLNVQFQADYPVPARGSLLYNALGEDFYESFVSINGRDRWLMHHFLQPGEPAPDEARLLDTIRMASGVPEIPIRILGVSPWVMSPKVAKTWVAGRILLAGDAAARLSPAGGLGLNNGIQGMHNLAWKLAHVVHGQASPLLLHTYEEERLTCSLELMSSSNRNAEEVFAIIAQAMLGQWEGVRLRIAHSLRGGAGLGLDLGLCYEEGAFVPDGSPQVVPDDVVNDYVPSARPGSRAPHVPLSDGGSTLDLMGGRFVVLVGRSGGLWRDSAPCPVLMNGVEFEAADFEERYGIGSGGCVLVRPDGYVAARFPAESGDLQAALRTILGW